MEYRPITDRFLAGRNFRRKPFRSACMAALVALFAFTLFGGTMLTMSLNNGMNNLSARLGADILAVPYGYEADIQNALLRGEPSGFYFDEGFTEKIAGAEGVAAVSPQLYIATLNADCCALPIQIIGFDETTDFVVSPWLENALKGGLPDGEIVVGDSINAEPGAKLKFFGKIYTVAAGLDKTGMGFDTSIFMNFATAREAVKDSERVQKHPVAEDDGQISSVAVKVGEGYDGKTVANNILQAYAIEGVDVVVAKNLISDVSGSLRGLSAYLYILSGILWVLAVGVLILVFAVSLNARKREFGTYRVLGAPKSRLIKIVIMEAAMIGLLGALAGTVAAAALFFPFGAYIRSLVSLPFLLPSLGAVLLVAALSLVVSAAIGPLSALYTAVKLNKSEIEALWKD